MIHKETLVIAFNLTLSVLLHYLGKFEKTDFLADYSLYENRSTFAEDVITSSMMFWRNTMWVSRNSNSFAGPVV